MSVSMSGRYLGGLGVELTHGPSGTVITTAAPVDNQGDGSSFSPTDLLASSLGACAVTILAIVGERLSLDMTAMRFSVTKEMADQPRRIKKLTLEITMPANLTEAQSSKLERAAKTCPVLATLSPEVEVALTFVYPPVPVDPIRSS